MNIGEQIGYWDEKRADRERKQAKVDRLVRRVRSCRTFDGLEKVADDARGQGLWHPVRQSVSECNARLRGRNHPVKYTDGEHTLIVSDDRVLDVPVWFSAQTPRQLCEEGFRYAGQAEE